MDRNKLIELQDTHCHLNLPEYTNDIAQVIIRAEQNHIKKILVPGIDMETSHIAIELSEQFPNVFAAVGIHPNSRFAWDKNTLLELEKIASHKKVVAIGEIGLDYYRNANPREKQIKLLEAQLDLAKRISLPVVLHCRNSFDDLWTIINKWHQQIIEDSHPLSQRPGVFHAFDGNLSQALSVTQNNFYLGIGGPITYKNSENLIKVVKGVEINQILLETDSPFLAPRPHRGKRNEPSFLVHIADCITENRNIDLSCLSESTTKNSYQLFLWE